MAKVRNKPGGFWVAATDPAAAYEALTGSFPFDQIESVGIYSDGITRLAERYGRSWDDLFKLGADRGLDALVDEVRAAESADPEPMRWRGKLHDDATAVLLRKT